jgi:hypothetical protein
VGDVAIGDKIGRLTLVSLWPATWQCECRNPQLVRVPVHKVTGGNTRSCGCLRAEKAAERAVLRNTTHGLSHRPGYKRWKLMIARCTDVTSDDWNNYGGRGIKVCERWLRFENFLEDMGDPPEGMTLDRKDNDGNYEPGNCRWATPLEQASNRRDKYTSIIDADGVRALRARYDAGEDIKAIAANTGYDFRFVRRIVRRKRWKGVRFVRRIVRRKRWKGVV